MIISIKSNDDVLVRPDVLGKVLTDFKDKAIQRLEIRINYMYISYLGIFYTDAHHEILKAWLEKRKTPIDELNLNGNSIRDEGMQQILKIIVDNPNLHLKKLCINENSFGEATLQLILQLIKKQKINFKVEGFKEYRDCYTGYESVLTSTTEAKRLIKEIRMQPSQMEPPAAQQRRASGFGGLFRFLSGRSERQDMKPESIANIYTP